MMTKNALHVVVELFEVQNNIIEATIGTNIYTLCIMPRSRSGPGNKSHQNKAGGLTLNLFWQFCVLFQANIILKDI